MAATFVFILAMHAIYYVLEARAVMSVCNPSSQNETHTYVTRDPFRFQPIRCWWLGISQPFCPNKNP